MNTHARRTLAAIAVASVVASTLAACSSSGAASTDSVSSVTVMSGQQSQNGSLLQGLIGDYQNQPGAVHVDLRMNNVTDVQTAQQALLDLAAGHGPDAVRVTSATYQTLIDSGAAQPASTCLSSDPRLRSQLDSKILASIDVKGSPYQIPWYVTPNALFYNANLFKEAGLNPNDPPTTFREFTADARKIVALPGHPAGGVTYFGNDYNFQGYVASLGGTVYDPNTKKVGIDTPQGVAVLDAFRQMVADGASPVYSNFFTDANDAFAGGKLGMIVTSSSGYPALSAKGGFDLRIAPAPHPDGGTAIAVSSTNGFVITTKDPARQRAVCKVLLSLLTPAAVTKTVSATSTIPINTTTIDSAQYLKPVFAKNPDWSPVLGQKVIPWASLPGRVSNEYNADYVNAQTKVLNGSESPSGAAAALQSSAQGLVQ